MSSEVRNLFEVTGIEVEYMLVDQATLDVQPGVDRVLKEMAGSQVNDVKDGEVTWSNELALHVLELKIDEPAATLQGLDQVFADKVRIMNDRLKTSGTCLMPTGAHPWMNPKREMRVWPHGDQAIYKAFDRIFGCRSHGWANVQSMHINLPFGDDEEFGRLHAAIRLLLPILPGLAASSPFMESRFNGLLDSRLEVYRFNARKIPSLSGRVIPEPVFDMDAYRETILAPIYRDLEPHDPEGLLRYEWSNARGAIARFDRNAIEVRLLDSQECPTADLAIAWAVTHVLKVLTEERWCSLADQKSWAVEPLHNIFLETIQHGNQAEIVDKAYLSLFGYQRPGDAVARDLWTHLITEAVPEDASYTPVLETLMDRGCLARRILQGVGEQIDRETLTRVYRDLCACLENNQLYLP